jgi:hypothetical protein
VGPDFSEVSKFVRGPSGLSFRKFWDFEVFVLLTFWEVDGLLLLLAV